MLSPTGWPQGDLLPPSNLWYKMERSLTFTPRGIVKSARETFKYSFPKGPVVKEGREPKKPEPAALLWRQTPFILSWCLGLSASEL